MSVVNKMLKDLEQRESSDVTPANYQPPAKKPVPVRLLVIILVGVIAIGLMMFWPMDSNTPVVQSPVVQPINQSNAAETNIQEQPQPEETALSPQTDPVVADQLPQAEINQPVAVPPTRTAPTVQTEVPEATASNESLSLPVVESEPKLASKPVVKSSSDPGKMALKAQIADAIERNNANEAIRLLKILILQQPDNIGAKKRLAALYFSEGRSEDAQRVLQDTLSQVPSDSSVRLMYARLMAQQNEQDLAYYTLKAADDYPPANIELLGFRASIAQQLGKLDDALTDYNVLVTIDARNAKWWLGLAVVADKQGERKLAIESYREAFALQSLDANIQQFIQQRLQSLTGVTP